MTTAVRSFRDLRVWQRGMDLVLQVYDLTKRFPREELYALVQQIRRAAVSIPANIAEGHARQHRKEYLQHLSISRGSLAELLTLFLVAERVGYLKREQVEAIEQAIQDVRMPLSGLILRLQAKEP